MALLNHHANPSLALLSKFTKMSLMDSTRNVTEYEYIIYKYIHKQEVHYFFFFFWVF